MSTRKFVTIAAIANHLGVTPRTVRNYISQGFFPAYRIPGTRGVRLDPAEVDFALKMIPTTRARPITKQFGPKARILTVPRQPITAVSSATKDEQ